MDLYSPRYKLDGASLNVSFGLLLPHVVIKVLMQISNRSLVIPRERVTQRRQQVPKVSVRILSLAADNLVDRGKLHLRVSSECLGLHLPSLGFNPLLLKDGCCIVCILLASEVGLEGDQKGLELLKHHLVEGKRASLEEHLDEACVDLNLVFGAIDSLKSAVLSVLG